MISGFYARRWEWFLREEGKALAAGKPADRKKFYEQLLQWTNDEKILTFVFEAFDEPWKGSPDLLEPEKHWGLFNVERKPKLVMQALYGELLT